MACSSRSLMSSGVAVAAVIAGRCGGSQAVSDRGVPSLGRVRGRRRTEPHLGVRRSSEGASIALWTPPRSFSFTVGDVTIQTAGEGGPQVSASRLLFLLLSAQPPRRAFCQALVQGMTGDMHAADCYQEQQR